jgi:hypothetical protein
MRQILHAAPLRFPGAAQHEVMRGRTGIVTNAESAKDTLHRVRDTKGFFCTTTSVAAPGKFKSVQSRVKSLFKPAK